MNPGRDEKYSHQLRAVYLESAKERTKYKGRSYRRPPVGDLSSLKEEKNHNIDNSTVQKDSVIDDFIADDVSDQTENIYKTKSDEDAIAKPYQFEKVVLSSSMVGQNVTEGTSKERVDVKPVSFEKISYADLALETRRRDIEDKLSKVLKDRENRGQMEQKLSEAIAQTECTVLLDKEKTTTSVEIPSAVKQAMTIAQYRQQREYELKNVLPKNTSNSTQDFASVFAAKVKTTCDNKDIVMNESGPNVDPKEVLLREIREKTNKQEENREVSLSKKENKKNSFFQKASQKVHSIFQKGKKPKQYEETVLTHRETERKKLITRLKAATASFLVMTLGLQVHSVIHDAEEDVSSQIKFSQDFIDTEENSFGLSVEIGMGKVATVIEEQQTKMDFEVEEDQLIVANETQFLLGQSIVLNEDVKVYMNEQDAYLEENALSSYYSNQDERVIIGVLVEKEDSMMRLSANQENANETLQSMLDDGGEVVSVLTANKNYALSDYDGTTTLSAAEINASAEGWYNVGDISLEKIKTLCK